MVLKDSTFHSLQCSKYIYTVSEDILETWKQTDFGTNKT